MYQGCFHLAYGPLNHHTGINAVLRDRFGCIFRRTIAPINAIYEHGYELAHDGHSNAEIESIMLSCELYYVVTGNVNLNVFVL